MQKRIFFRVMIDMFLNNAIFKSIVALVNFCNEHRDYNKPKLKFFKNMPTNKLKEKAYYKNRFIFNSITTNRNFIK